MCRIGVEWAKKIIMATGKNFVRDVTIHLTRRFWTRQAMFRHRQFSGATNTDTMIAGVKYMYGDRVAQVYVTDFGDVRKYLMAHRREAHTVLSRYLMDDRGI